MGYIVKKFESTPNPNAIKCVLDRAVIPPDAPPRSYRSAASASGDPVAAALFAIGPAGAVTGVLMSADWITVNKSPEADWKRIKNGVRDALAGAVPAEGINAPCPAPGTDESRIG